MADLEGWLLPNCGLTKIEIEFEFKRGAASTEGDEERSRARFRCTTCGERNLTEEEASKHKDLLEKTRTSYRAKPHRVIPMKEGEPAYKRSRFSGILKPSHSHGGHGHGGH